MRSIKVTVKIINEPYSGTDTKSVKYNSQATKSAKLTLSVVREMIVKKQSSFREPVNLSEVAFFPELEAKSPYSEFQAYFTAICSVFTPVRKR